MRSAIRGESTAHERYGESMLCRPRLVVSVAVLAGCLVLPVAQPANAEGVDPAGKQGSTGIQDPPTSRGWEQVSPGVFVYTRRGDPTLIERSRKARAGRNLTIRVSERVHLDRVLLGGEVTRVDTSERGRLRVPGKRIHDRGALLYVSGADVDPRNVRAQSAAGSYAWMYVDTDARVNDRGRLVGAAFLEPEYVQAVLRSNLAETVKVWGMIDVSGRSFLVKKGTPFTATVEQFAGEQSSFGMDKTQSLEINVRIGSGSPIHVVLRNPNFGRPDVSIESSLRPGQGLSERGFSEQYRCYYTVDDPSVDERYAFVVKRDDDTDTKNFELEVTRADSVLSDFGYMERCDS